MAAIEGYGFTVTGATIGALVQVKEVQVPGIATSRIDTTIHGSASDMATGVPSTLRRIPPVTVTAFMDTGEYIDLLDSTKGCGKSQQWVFTDADDNTTTVTGWIDSVEVNGMAADGSDAIEVTMTFEFTGTVAHATI